MRKLITSTGIAVTALGAIAAPAYAAEATAKGAVTVNEGGATAKPGNHHHKLTGATESKTKRSGAIKGEAAGKNTAAIKAPAGKADFAK